MSRLPRICRFPVLSLATLSLLGLAITAPVVEAGGRQQSEPQPLDAALFDAMEAGQVEVDFIPQDATKANLLVKNLTDKPLHLEMPAAFAGVPAVLAQGMMGGGMGGMGGGMGGMGGGMGGGGMGGGGGQAMGGGMGGMGGGGMGGMGGGGMGGGMMGGGGGFMRVPPERAQKVAVNTVCLEHDKPDPNPKMDYTIVPLDKFTQDAHVHVVCEALGYGLVTQNVAQAAAWHFTDDLSWQELAQKNRVESRYRGNIRYFTPLEMQHAVALVGQAKRVAAEQSDESGSAGESEENDSLESDSQRYEQRVGKSARFGADAFQDAEG